MTPESANKMFLAAAIFNWIVGAVLFFIPALFLGLFWVTPAPEQSLWVQQFGALVFVFGIGYYWIARDFEANLPIVRMGIIGKIGVVLVGLLNVMAGDISWQFMLPASADLVFAALFIMALNSRQGWKSNEAA